MSLQKQIIFLLLFLSSFLSSSSFAYSTVDQMNKQGTSTKVVRVYTGQWKGWDHHDRFANKAIVSTNKKHPSLKKKLSENLVSSEFIRSAAKKLKIGQPKAKIMKVTKPRVLTLTRPQKLKAKKTAVITHHSKQLSADSIRHFAKSLNIRQIEKKSVRKYRSHKTVIRKPIPLKSSNTLIKRKQLASEVSKDKKTSEDLPAVPVSVQNKVRNPSNWSTVNQSMPLLMKALSE